VLSKKRCIVLNRTTKRTRVRRNRCFIAAMQLGT